MLSMSPKTTIAAKNTRLINSVNTIRSNSFFMSFVGFIYITFLSALLILLFFINYCPIVAPYINLISVYAYIL
jgi:hypothetical protein